MEQAAQGRGGIAIFGTIQKLGTEGLDFTGGYEGAGLAVGIGKLKVFANLNGNV